MRILVIGLDCATPELLLGDERLENIRRLMDGGCYGSLESIVPPMSVPAWMCMATSQDPGSLGVYGFRNRVDHSYNRMKLVDSQSINTPAIWDQVARERRKSVIVGVPPCFPPRRVSGISVGCFLTPDTTRSAFTYPADIGREIVEQFGTYPVDIKDFRTHDKARLKREIYAMSRTHFAVVRHLMRNTEWDYLHLVEIGLDRLQHGFWKRHDSGHVLHEPDSPYRDVIRDYYRYLDEEIGSLLELLEEETLVLVVSDHGARKLDGGFCVNEWLVREGLLVLNHYPDEVTPFAKLDVNWDRTRAWSDGGYYARVFLNVRGREPRGAIDPEDYERVRDEIKERFEATTDPLGKPLGTLVFRPEDIYRNVHNVAPDLIVHLGGLAWRSIGGVGYSRIHVTGNDTGPDDCNHDQQGAFVLSGSNCPALGPVEGAQLLDIPPTLLTLGGFDVPPGMQGRSLADAQLVISGASSEREVDDEELVRARLSGLGYIA
jgi:predicted AlkP superfamily phosphohydrolase/phosphomutase